MKIRAFPLNSILPPLAATNLVLVDKMVIGTPDGASEVLTKIWPTPESTLMTYLLPSSAEAPMVPRIFQLC
jgi:hypothetical protein